MANRYHANALTPKKNRPDLGQMAGRYGLTLAGLLLAQPAAAQRRGLLGGSLGASMRELANLFAGRAGLSEVPLSYVVARVIMMFLSLVGIIMVGLITYAGYNWVTARGNEEKVKKAQDTLRQAIWGLIITLAAYSISYFITWYLLANVTTGSAPLETTTGSG